MKIIENYKTSIVLGTIFLILNILDAHSTWKVCKPDKFECEMNPVARFVFKKMGLKKGIISFKVFLLSIFGTVVYKTMLITLKELNIILVFANLLFAYIVGHNYKIVKKRKK